MKSDCLLRIALLDVRHNMTVHFAAAAAAVASTPVWAGINELNERMAARPLELISLIAGMILLTPIYMPEQDKNIYDVVRTKKTSHMVVCLIRFLTALTVAALLILCLSLTMKYNSSDITLRLFASAAGGAFALGSIGMFASAVGNSSVTGYMVSSAYLVMNAFLRKKLGVFDLLPVSDGFTELSIWPYFAALILAASSLIIRKYSVD